MIISEIARAIATGEARPELTRLKAATATGTTSGWGAVLAQPAIANDFAEALPHAGLFDRLLADGFRRGDRAGPANPEARIGRQHIDPGGRGGRNCGKRRCQVRLLY